jgi:hypothetical protein
MKYVSKTLRDEANKRASLNTGEICQHRPGSLATSLSHVYVAHENSLPFPTARFQFPCQYILDSAHTIYLCNRVYNQSTICPTPRKQRATARDISFQTAKGKQPYRVHVGVPAQTCTCERCSCHNLGELGSVAVAIAIPIQTLSSTNPCT